MTTTTFTSSLFTNYSNVTSNNSTTTSTMPVWIRIVTLTCMILIDISAFLGNLLVICAFFRTRRLQTVTNYFIASLAFADALVAIFVLPLSIYCYQRDRSWKLGLILCDLWVSSDVLLCTSSILNLACISVDRYMAITKPLTYTAYRSKFLARVMILLVWIVSAVITCPPIFGWRDKNRRETVEVQHHCDLNNARGYVVYSALGSFYIPGVVMIFVYIRIFMVVYDRENLIKKFHNNLPSNNNNNNIQSSNLNLKSNQNGTINHANISNNKKKFQKLSACCCFCFRKKKYQDNQSLTTYPAYNNGPAIEQKQNGYLIYRFTNNNNKHNNSNSPVNSPSITSKSSLFGRTCENSTKQLNNLSDEMYQYRRNYLSHVNAEYQVRNDDSPCYELQTFEDTISPLMKCRSRSFEHSAACKIRDLNTELSHSRQLKAAAVAAAAAGSTTQANPNNIFPNKYDFDEHLILTSDTSGTNNIFPLINEDSRQTTQSLNELTQLSIIPNTPKYHRHYLKVLPMRERAITNPPKIIENFSTSLSDPYSLRQKQHIPEPTRINRRVKSSRSINTSPSAILLENIKQQHKITRNPSLRSVQSARSVASLRFLTNASDNTNETIRQKKCIWCCCSCNTSSVNNLSQNMTRQIFVYTPNQSVTDDDDEKISSTDTANRTPIYTPALSSNIPRASSASNGAPADVHRRERIRFMKEQKTAKTLAVVVGGFILLWLPFFIMYIIPEDKKKSLDNQTATLITWLGYFNSVINPFIYAYCSKQFRMAFWNITFGLCIKKSSALLPITNKNKQIHQRRINA
ncbi:unnamed protein product [Adineta steineri]|uniref:G-protein coupled receptors family 1 profile domain-containing protein n=1 Tax=Adineta steineri TaxID=433720 RepID=A0A818J074_9BILA|nr:unnamed protein product [Adineta steineri]CAF3533470.1 unnamed protein product [Adineta steineri]